MVFAAQRAVFQAQGFFSKILVPETIPTQKTMGIVFSPLLW
jgi:hypothetical protein